MTDFKPRVEEVLRGVVYTLARQTPEVMRRPSQLEAVAQAIPALTPDISVAWVDTLDRLELLKNEEAAARYQQYEERLKAERHDKEYWMGRAPQAVGDMQEQAARLAEKTDRALAVRIRALRIGW
jgi:hypothetical protein